MTFTSWVFTVIIAGLISAALFAQGAYAPSIIQAKQIQQVWKCGRGHVHAHGGCGTMGCGVVGCGGLRCSGLQCVGLWCRAAPRPPSLLLSSHAVGRQL
eukprot:223817-Chlamydomonas_euryale.AAC.10